MRGNQKVLTECAENPDLGTMPHVAEKAGQLHTVDTQETSNVIKTCSEAVSNTHSRIWINKHEKHMKSHVHKSMAQGTKAL